MAYAYIDDIIGSQSISNFFVPDVIQRQVLGSQITAADNVWGGGEFIYLKAGATILMGAAVVWDLGWNAVLAPSVANQGRTVAFAVYPMTIGQFGMFQVSGMAVVNATASVAIATPFGITAVGQVGANSAGKQIVNATSVAPSTTTIVKNNVLVTAGSNVLQTGNTDSWFFGVTVSGTGIPGATTIMGMSPDGRSVTMSANATASGVVTVTGTYTGFIIAQIQRPFAQGAIT